MKLRHVGVMALAALCAAIGGTAQSAEKSPLGRSVVYKEVDGRALHLFVEQPADWKASDSRPAVVFFHGGGWSAGAPNQFNEQCRYLASRGMVCVQVEYRLLKPRTTDLPTPCINDAKSAMRWVRSHAQELGIDSARIAAAGGSAGGHLAAFVGLAEGIDDPQDDLRVSPKANALVLFNPVLDNGPDGGWAQERVGDRFREFSPAHQISADDPPTIVFLGTKDNLIPVAVMEHFRKAVEQAGVRCELKLYEGQAHGFFNFGRGDGQYYYETLMASDRFLASLGWLAGPPTLEKPVR